MSATAPTRSHEHVAHDHGDRDSGGGVDRRVPWGRVIALAGAFAFLGGAIGFALNEDRPPGAGSVDVGFYQDMSVHHNQGVDMALVALDADTSETVRTFAREIVTFQSYELGLMNAQLDDWGRTPGEEDDTAMDWMGMAVPLDAMPGLATQDQLDALRQAEGTEADILFLELMAEHHRGGIHMASFAARHADDAGVRELAQRMATNQGFEINEFVQAAERDNLDADIEPYRTNTAHQGVG